MFNILIDYMKWDNFLATISKAKTASEISGKSTENHFETLAKWSLQRFKTVMMPKTTKS